MAKLTVETATAPIYWASYLINADSSGMEDAEIKRCDAWISSLGWGMPCGVEEDGFYKYHDAIAFSPYACDVAIYTFLVPEI